MRTTAACRGPEGSAVAIALAGAASAARGANKPAPIHKMLPTASDTVMGDNGCHGEKAQWLVFFMTMNPVFLPR
jgi:hypothetical protein